LSTKPYSPIFIEVKIGDDGKRREIMRENNIIHADMETKIIILY